MADPIKVPETLTRREKLVIILVIFLVQMLKPWEYSHQFTKFWDEIKETMNEK